MTQIQAMVKEQTDTWEVTLNGKTHTFSSAGEALRYLKKYAKGLAESGSSSVMQIVWEPMTRIGKIAVKILTEVGSNV